MSQLAALRLAATLEAAKDAEAAKALRARIGLAAGGRDDPVLLLPGQPVRNWPLVLPAGFKVYVRVDAGDCNVVAWGEEDFPAVIA